jgi:hypothetical protein
MDKGVYQSIKYIIKLNENKKFININSLLYNLILYKLYYF